MTYLAPWIASVIIAAFGVVLLIRQTMRRRHHKQAGE